MAGPSELWTLFVGASAAPRRGPLRVANLIESRRLLGEGLDDGTGPPGALLRALWAYFRCGGRRALVVPLGPEARCSPLGGVDLAALGAGIAAGLEGETPPLVVLPGYSEEAEAARACAELELAWPDPSPLVLLDLPRTLARDPAAAAALAAAVRRRSGGRVRLVGPRLTGAAPVQGPSRPGPVSPAAVAAGLVANGGLARIAGAGLALGPQWSEAETRQLREAGLVVLAAAGPGALHGLGLPRWRPVADQEPAEQRLDLDESPFGPLVRYLEGELSHHVGQPLLPSLLPRVERDARAALARYFGRERGGYRVRCDAELNPPDERGDGAVVLEVVLAPPLPVVRELVLRLSLR